MDILKLVAFGLALLGGGVPNWKLVELEGRGGACILLSVVISIGELSPELSKRLLIHACCSSKV